jgi:DNA-directed RNA polymerase subunit RPC12/RpoP
MSDKQPAPYPDAWARIQRARSRVNIGLLAFIGLELLLQAFVPRHSPRRWLVLVPLLVGAVVMIAYLGRIRCPHCGKGIMLRGRQPVGLREGKCPHCGTQVGPPKTALT